MSKQRIWLSASYLTTTLLLILSGCATIPKPVSHPSLQIAILHAKPIPTKPSTPTSPPNFANNRFDFESVWHSSLHRDLHRSINCVSLEKVQAQDPEAATSCWNNLAHHFRSQAQWIIDIVPKANIPANQKWVYLLEAEHSAISFFEHSAQWAKACGSDFGTCLQKAGALRTIKAQVKREIARSQ